MNDLKNPLFANAVDCWGYYASACCVCTSQLIELLTKSEWVSMMLQALYQILRNQKVVLVLFREFQTISECIQDSLCLRVQ